MRAFACSLLLLAFVARVSIAALYDEQYRPQFHFSAQQGWLNDPNGLVYLNGQYHMFFQHNPFGTSWGDMSWGHATSPDLIHWTEHTPAIVGDPTGVKFSGSAVIDYNNSLGLQSGSTPTMALFYTNVGSFDQRMAYSTDGGESFRYYTGNPVLPSISGQDDRDPHVFWDDTSNKWVQAVWVAAHAGKPAAVDFFGSSNLKNWNYLSENANYFECPDFFKLPVDGNANNSRWVLYGGDGQYQVGSWDGTKFTPDGSASTKYVQDFGANFYAARSWNDVPASDGRRLQVAWMNGASYPGMPFNQQMSFPVELTLRNTPNGIRMFRDPVAEISELHQTQYSLNNATLTPSVNPLGTLSGDLFHIKTSIELGSASSVGFNVRGNPVTYDVATQTLSALGRSTTMAPTNGRISLELLIDRSSLEVFGNDGLVSMTSGFTPSSSNHSTNLFSTGGNARVISLSAYQLGSAWPNTQPTPSPGLIGRWKFDEPSNTADFVDDGGSDFMLANSGLQAGVQGISGSAVKVNNSTNYAFVPGSTGLNANSFSLAAWIQPNTVGQNGQPATLVSKTNSQQGAWALQQLSDGRFKFFVTSASGATDFVQTATPVNSSSWHHTVATYNSASGRLELYVDGVLAGSHQGSVSGPLMYDTNALMIGQRTGATSQPMDGRIDEMQLYGSVLTADQIGYLRASPGTDIDPTTFQLGTLKLRVNADTGQTSIIDGNAATVQLKGYSILSNNHALKLGAWQSLQNNPSYVGWQQANPTTSALNELNPTTSLAVTNSSQIPLGSPVGDYSALPFGTPAQNTDVSFQYTTADGKVLHGLVELSGLRTVNNLLLTVDPATGQAQLMNSSPKIVRLHGYSILSASGSLKPANGAWLSLSDQAVPGVDEANASASNLSELFPFPTDSITLSPGQKISLGTPFKTVAAGGAQDLQLQFVYDNTSAVNGDYNNDGVVNTADYVVWRSSFGTAATLPNEAATPGQVTMEDYQVWRSNFGAAGTATPTVMNGVVQYNSLSAGAGAQTAQVPEPSALLLATTMLIFIASFQRRAR